MEDGSKDWKATTPDHLVPAIGHIRKTFDDNFWKCSTITEKLCFEALHPNDPSHVDLASYRSSFLTYLTIVSPSARQNFDRTMAIGTPPAIFQAYFEIFRRGVEADVRSQFHETLQIAIANQCHLSLHPIEWTRSHIKLMIEGNSHILGLWIKRVCDQQDYSKFETDKDFDEMVFWHSWRLPQLVHMKPSGNTPYRAECAWTREDEARTATLLTSLSERFIEFVGFELKRITGAAYVMVAQREGEIKLPSAPNATARQVTAAPRPPTELRGSTYAPPLPKPTRAPLDFPAYYPNTLKVQTTVIMATACRKFPAHSQILELCRNVISELIPHIAELVGAKEISPERALAHVADLLRSLLICNCDDSEKRFQLEQEVRHTDEWLNLAEAMAGRKEATPADNGARRGRSSEVPLDAPTSWENIEIWFLSDVKVQIRVNGVITEPCNYAELGFEDGRDETPTQAWALLRVLAELEGTVHDGRQAHMPWPKVEKRIQEIRKALQRHFGIAANPISFVEGTGYVTNFKIGCKRSFGF